jgi:hypothetical protein
MFINCSTSPSAMTLVASASTCMMRMLPASTIIWKAREYRKSPTSTLAGCRKSRWPWRGRAQGGLVDHVVVQQGGGVDELDHCRQVEALVPR